ncbi:conserved hypothetical protein [Ricinus communis]|uniref:Uncharacterized protein n=1 Tax=Ricinus communis TaxID=3988 RepID=B9SXL3_RICCO|nr:conserved hypothetical protein [Ricinus communis]
MGFSKKDMFMILLIVSISLASVQLGAMRPLGGEEWLKGDNGLLVFQSLQKSDNPQKPGSNPCSNIPGGTGVCSMNIAGNVMVRAPAFPSLVMDAAAASIANKIDPNHASANHQEVGHQL